MAKLELLAHELVRLSTILERVEPKVEALDARLDAIERRNARWVGMAAAAGTLLGFALPVLIRLLTG